MVGDSFHCLTASSDRVANRLRCSSRSTESQNLTKWMPYCTNIFSNSGADPVNSKYSCGVQYPVTRSTLARFHQERSKMTVSPAVGRCCTYLWNS